MIDWPLVKKLTLWNYEELLLKINEVMSYGIIKEHYNHDMREAVLYAKKLLGFDPKRDKYIKTLSETFTTLEDLGIKNYTDLINRIDSRDNCEDFLKCTKFAFEDLMVALNHVFRWVLPHKIYMRELIDEEDEDQKTSLETLRSFGIKFNLDILDKGRTRVGRADIIGNTGIPESTLMNFVNLADMSRLPYSNRKTVKYLQSGGYNSLKTLAQDDSERIVFNMRAYFEKSGIKLTGFIDLKGIAQWAKTIPVVVQE